MAQTIDTGRDIKTGRDVETGRDIDTGRDTSLRGEDESWRGGETYRGTSTEGAEGTAGESRGFGEPGRVYGRYYGLAMRRISRRLGRETPRGSTRPWTPYAGPSWQGGRGFEGRGEEFERGRGQEFERRGGEEFVGRSGEQWRGEGGGFEEGGYRGGRSQATRGYGEFGPGIAYDRARGYGYGESYGRGRESGWQGRESAYGRSEPRGWGGTETIDERSQWPQRFGEEYGGFEAERRPSHWQREPLTAGDLMTRDVKAVTKQTTLRHVAEIMKDENCGIVPVVDESHKLVGVVTDRDIVIRALAEDKPTADLKVEDIMTEDVEAVTPDEELKDVIEVMGEKQVRRVPVVHKDDRLVGIISIGDIATRADYDEDLADALEKISSKRSFWSRIWS
jgi:CBS domain-containing protein